MKFLPLIVCAIVAALIVTSAAQGHLVAKPKNDTLKARLHSQTVNLGHARYVCNRGANQHKRWSCHAVKWLTTERNETLRKIAYADAGYWGSIQIYYATRLATEFPGNHWPNCPDPFDGTGASWVDTVRCENRGMFEKYGLPTAWLDSAGFFRCGLQFHPMWERHYGRKFCP